VIRVVVAEDQAMVRGAIAALLSLEPDIEVVGEAGRGDEVAGLVAEAGPDVVLLDIEMPGLDGLSVARALRDAGASCRTIILTTFGRPGYLQRAMAAGAAGFLLKDAPVGELAAAIRRVAEGGVVVDPGLAAQALSEGMSPLTAREQEVLRAAAGGASIAGLAATLHLSEGTVRNHLSSAIQKIGVRNRAEAVLLAQRKGWL
jgi:two-component system, NarL family, response regulator DesR